MAQPLAEERRIHDPAWLKEHLDGERRRSDLLAEIREAVFGAQDGIVSILTVVSTLGGATSDNHIILLGGIATTVAAMMPLLPYRFFALATALIVSVVLSGVALFVLGVVRARWPKGHAIRSGLEIVTLAAVAGIGGYLVGRVLPELVARIHP